MIGDQNALERLRFLRRHVLTELEDATRTAEFPPEWLKAVRS